MTCHCHCIEIRVSGRCQGALNRDSLRTEKGAISYVSWITRRPTYPESLTLPPIGNSSSYTSPGVGATKKLFIHLPQVVSTLHFLRIFEARFFHQILLLQLPIVFGDENFVKPRIHDRMKQSLIGQCSSRSPKNEKHE